LAGWHGGELVAVPEQQKALTRMRTMRAGGAALRAIAEQITADGVKISHVGGKQALAAAEREAA
jgi:hypothetical protein